MILFVKGKYGLFKLEKGEKRKGKFCDLGSGIGKPSVTAALTLPDYFAECTGFELLDGLYDLSLELAEEYAESEWAKARGLDENWEKNDCPVVNFKKQDFIEDY